MLGMGKKQKAKPDANGNYTTSQTQSAAYAPTFAASETSNPLMNSAPNSAASEATNGRANSHANGSNGDSATEKQAAASRAYTETESLARAMKDGAVGGFVGAGTTFVGDMTFKAMLRVDGDLSGRVKSEKGTIIVSDGGQVEGNVEVAVAKINGAVNGDIIASQRIEFGRTARVVGNITTPELVIEPGAVFEGGCRMRGFETAQKAEGATVGEKRLEVEKA